MNAAKILAAGGLISSLLVGVGGLFDLSLIISVAGFVMLAANLAALLWRDKTSGAVRARQNVDGIRMARLSFDAFRAANRARQDEWQAGNPLPSLSFRGNELAGEVGEACNVIKKLDRERLGLRGSRATTSALADELADVIICADLIAAQEGIDLGSAVVRKFNHTSAKIGLATTIAIEKPDPEMDR